VKSGDEVAVIGLGASGIAATQLLLRDGRRVYASDGGRTAAVETAAATLRRLGADCDVGQHDLDRIRRAADVVVSPGVPPTAAPLQAARAAHVPVISEVELALAHLSSVRTIAVTGTNGKTTTTALIGHILRGLGYDALDAGNIGLPLASVALRATRPAWVALELSSFQLHDTPSIAPTVGVLTNLSPDHLDRYPTIDAYYGDKARLFANADETSRLVVNADDPASLSLVASVPGQHFRFSIDGATADAVYRDGMLAVAGDVLLPRRELPLLGDHNVANALAAALAVAVADPAHRTANARRLMADAIRSFRALVHRLELVGTYAGVRWINDSKATNVSSARVAVESMTGPTILLLGGRHKGEPYTPLADALRRVGKAVLVYGEAAPLIESDLAGVVPLERFGSEFEPVVARARALARTGDTILLAPACSSYDMFRNYEERGATFGRLAGAEGEAREP
jgi:UDP-N-acetylmuramoylalanine--D-glutamate ligase